MAEIWQRDRAQMTRTYGGTYRGPCRTERPEQIDAISWLSIYHPERFPLIFHCPSETRATASHMQMRAKEGVKPGIPDIIDMAGPVLGLFEMKRRDRTKSSLSKAQKDVLAAAERAGHFTAICYGVDAFKEAYADFLSLHG